MPMLSAIDCSAIRQSRRSCAIKPRPSATASEGLTSETSTPSTTYHARSRLPDHAPYTASAASMQPAPRSPKRPTTSPLRTARSRFGDPHPAGRIEHGQSREARARHRPPPAAVAVRTLHRNRRSSPRRHRGAKRHRSACRPRIRPSRMTTMRSEMAKTSASRWETKMMATPRAFSRRMRSKRRCDSCSVRAAVGSSRMRRRAFLASARAMTTSCCVARSSEDIARLGIDVEVEIG